MANRINANFKVLKNNQENTIKDAVFLKHLPELKEFMEAVDSAFERYKKKSHFEKCKERNKDLTLEDYEKTFYDKYIGINVIRDTIKGIAYSYKRVFGVHNTTVVKKS
jgi:gamma-glutamyl phosphate reductase